MQGVGRRFGDMEVGLGSGERGGREGEGGIALLGSMHARGGGFRDRCGFLGMGTSVGRGRGDGG